MSRLHKQPMRLMMVDIVSGVAESGTSLPREADLSLEFGVSRGVVREAIRGLEERGLITVKHGRGATVRPAADWNLLDPDVLGVLLDGDTGAAAVLGEFLEVRRLLEVEAAGLAAERARPEDLTSLAETLERTRSAAVRASRSRAAEGLFHEADIAFHRSVMAAAENRVLSRLTEPIQRALLVTRRQFVHPESRLEHGVAEHARIVRAIADGDAAGARAAMLEHLTTVESIVRHYEQITADEKRDS